MEHAIRNLYDGWCLTNTSNSIYYVETKTPENNEHSPVISLTICSPCIFFIPSLFLKKAVFTLWATSAYLPLA